MSATTADRIRLCSTVGEDIARIIFDLDNPGTTPEQGTKAAEIVFTMLQELWDAAYEAGRRDGAEK